MRLQLILAAAALLMGSTTALLKQENCNVEEEDVGVEAKEPDPEATKYFREQSMQKT
jgi:hypothetical protein